MKRTAALLQWRRIKSLHPLSRVEMLDASDPLAVRAYERGFYRAFIPYDNPGIRELWHWDDANERVAAKIPYEDQEIFLIRDRLGEVRTALALNVRVNQFQSEAFGFERPPRDVKWVETITIFSAGGAIPRLSCYEAARRRLTVTQGFACTYTTCSEKVLHLHQSVGAVVVGRKEFNGLVRYLIRQDADAETSFFRVALKAMAVAFATKAKKKMNRWLAA